MELHFPPLSLSQDQSGQILPVMVHWGGNDPVLSLPQPWSCLPSPRWSVLLGATDNQFFQEHFLGPLALKLTCIADLADFSTCYIHNFAFVLWGKAGSDIFTSSAPGAAVEAKMGLHDGMTLFSSLTSQHSLLLVPQRYLGS